MAQARQAAPETGACLARPVNKWVVPGTVRKIKIPARHGPLPSPRVPPHDDVPLPSPSDPFLYIHQTPRLLLHSFKARNRWRYSKRGRGSARMEEMTVTGLLTEAVKEFPSRRALSVPGKLDLTHARLRDLIDSAAAHLASCGVRPADVVALTFPNTVEFVIMFLAVIRARAVAAPLNPAYTQEEFEFYLSDSESKVLITNSEGNVAAVAAAAKLQIPHATATLPDPTGRVQISLPRRSDSALTSANVPSNVA